jgi:hypothetical protein
VLPLHTFCTTGIKHQLTNWGTSLTTAAAEKSNSSLGVIPVHTRYYGGTLAPVPEEKAAWNIWWVWTRIFLIKVTSLPLWFATGREFRLALGPPSLLYIGYQVRLPWGVKWPGHEADHSPPFSAKIKNVGAIPPLPIHLHGARTTLPLPSPSQKHECLCVHSQHTVQWIWPSPLI